MNSGVGKVEYTPVLPTLTNHSFAGNENAEQLPVTWPGGKGQGQRGGREEAAKAAALLSDPHPTLQGSASPSPHLTPSLSTPQLHLAVVSGRRRAGTLQNGLCKHSIVNR